MMRPTIINSFFTITISQKISRRYRYKVSLFLVLGILFLSFQFSNAATFMVTNNNNAGAGSLRQAILDANNDAVQDVIEFSIGNGLQTIQLLTPLPIIINDLVIDGTTQPGFVDIPIIEIDGSQQGNESIIRILGVAIGDIRGLVFNGGPINGIAFANCTGGMVDNCFLGTDATGTASDGNTFDGVSISNSNGIVIQNSVISGNGGDGMFITNASFNITVKNCKIGTDLTGTMDLGNMNRGILLDGSDACTIGGDTDDDRNIISGNTRHGVAITGNGNTVKGNYIGVDITGNLGLGNGLSGIIIQADNNIVGTSDAGNLISGNGNRGIEISLNSVGNIVHNNIVGLNVTGDVIVENITGILVGANTMNNSIGGSGENEGNIVSGNAISGVLIRGVGQEVQGNRIGTDINGLQDLGNGFNGVLIDGCTNCTVGGANLGDGNIISGNEDQGISIEGRSTGTNIDGNLIGTNITGDAAIGNEFNGIFIENCDNNNIGINAGNLISGNVQTGVRIDQGSTNNVLIGNLIGTDVTGAEAIPNDFGVVVTANSHNNFIGGAGGIEGNLISGNTFSGVIFSQNANENNVFGNLIGTNIAGAEALPNGQSGIVFFDSNNNLIGNGTEDAQNLISGNLFSGISLQDGSNGNQIMGNCIGTDLDGTADLGNGFSGVNISDSGNNVIGGPNGRNIISGNQLHGVSINDPNAQDNVIQNNIIGLDINGLAALPNDEFGIVVFGDSGPNQIGGLNLDEGNIVSANIFSGVITVADNQTIEGNKLGTDINGVMDLGNDDNGIFLNGSSNCTVTNNLISGNTLSGIAFNDEATNNLIRGNKIGTNDAGDAEIENSQSGIRMDDANNNIIGGTGVGESNLISGNATSGISMFTSDNNKVIGNKIGTDLTGNASIPNSDAIFLGTDSNANEIGGVNANEGNLLSGNNFDGIDLNTNSIGTIIKGNIIGLNVDGTVILPNGDMGIEIEDSPNTIIGGVTDLERNIVSGNDNIGIEIINSAADNAQIIGNFIGTNIDGTVNLGNGDVGIEIDADNVMIGGGDAGEGNLISGNGSDGILSFGDMTIIQGNKIGTDISGTFSIPNEDSGIDVNGDDALIGGSNIGEGNLSSGNESEGIESFGDGAVIKGNIIGMDIIGLNAIPNESSGMAVDGNDIQIGGQGINEGNLISANLNNGIDVFDGDNIVIEGNIIGLDINGTSAAANLENGISESSFGFVTIGGLVPAARNIISANGLNGILSFFGVDGQIIGNFIGTDISGTQDFGNEGAGVLFFASQNYNVGGDTPGSSNIIAFNDTDGIGLSDDQFFFSGFECEGILISENSIFNNEMEGIFFMGAQNQVAIPILTNLTSGSSPNIQGTLNGNPNTDYTVEFFKNFAANPSGNHEGQIFIESILVTTDGAGVGVINANLNEPINPTEIITATAREDNANTSEFSNGIVAGALPIELLSLTANSYEDYIQLRWTTETEINNKGFHIEKLNSENVWEIIGFVKGYGTQSSLSNYTYQDKNVKSGNTYYYRLKQEDFDGRVEHTAIVLARIDGRHEVGNFYPNPGSRDVHIKINAQEDENVLIELFDVIGRKVKVHEFESNQGNLISFPIDDLEDGKYSIRIIIKDQINVRKLIKSGH